MSLLSDDGILYLHSDLAGSTMAKLICDEIFGVGWLPKRNHVEAQRSRDTATERNPRAIHDTILLYCKGEKLDLGTLMYMPLSRVRVDKYHG